MSANLKIAEFPDVDAKLQKPTKQSAFEKQKADAEAKRRREAAETAAVYEDFVKSFDHDGGDDLYRESRSGPPDRPRLGAQLAFPSAGKRHFGASGASMKSGPGSLGPGSRSFGKKGPADSPGPKAQRNREDTRGRLGFDSGEGGPLSVSKVFDASDEEDETRLTNDRAEEKAIAKPTLRLANLPPNISTSAIKALIPRSITAENVRIVPPAGPSGTERKSTTAIVTLSRETPATEIDAAVSFLQNRYLGFGHYLTLHRHLSSATISSTALASATSSAAVSQPFAAKRVAEAGPNHAPAPRGYRNFAPPSSYGPPSGTWNSGGILHVPIRPPGDIRKLRMIHKVLESVLQHGLEFEALLMSRPQVQREEKWAWLWDARSEGGIWYRWRLWEIVTGSKSQTGQAKFVPLFEGSHAWKVPEQALPYEYITGVDEFVSDTEYNSSEEDEAEEEQRRPGDGPNQEQDESFLDPLEKSKLMHLLARLPKSLTKVRKGDVARITAFAITHAGRGADEVTEMVVSNVDRPFAYTSANLENGKKARDLDVEEGNHREASPLITEDKMQADEADVSAASLIGLYVVSDILSSSSTSGIRHAWRYRQLFETTLRNHKTFERLGMMAERNNWGRLRAEKWKRSVGLVLSLWEGWCVFPMETHELFVGTFENPPLPKKEALTEGTDKNEARWKPIESAAPTGGKSIESGSPTESNDAFDSAVAHMDVELDAESDDLGSEVEGWAVLEYSDAEWLLSDDEDIDGEALADLEKLRVSEQEAAVVGGLKKRVKTEMKSRAGAERVAAEPTSRKRMRAVDMFAGSGSE